GEPDDARSKREKLWDEQLKPEPWFQAVTTHLYPTIEGSAGQGALASLPGDVDRVFAAFIARSDEGYDRSIADTVSRVRDKEIWITEGGTSEPAATFGSTQAHYNGLWLHMQARSILAFARHKEVTVLNHHALFAQGNLMSAFRRANGGYQ